MKNCIENIEWHLKTVFKYKMTLKDKKKNKICVKWPFLFDKTVFDYDKSKTFLPKKKRKTLP